MLPRFLVPSLEAASGIAVLPPAEAHHLARVLRLRVGDEVAVFDGRGAEYRARVDNVHPDRVSLLLIEPIVSAPAPQVPMSLVQAILKGPAMDDVVRDATMVGVNAIVPVMTSRTIVRDVRPGALARWERVAVASAKQCRRSTVPQIASPMPLAQWLERDSGGLRVMMVEPTATGAMPMRVRALMDRPAPERAAVLVGPEGGWTPEEVRMATERGAVALTLGELTLRADAVALAALTALSVIWN